MLAGRYRASPAAKRARSSAGKVKSFPAPVKGWIANQNLAIAEPQGARILENWVPTATGARMRSGYEQFADTGAGSPVTALFSYVSGASKFLFAADETKIYDATAPISSITALVVDDLGSEMITDTGDIIGFDSFGAPVSSGHTSGRWISVQFSTAGGAFLRLVNGSNTPLVYDGASFATTPAITGVTGGASTLSYVWSFKNRLWFIKKGTLDAYYLPVDVVGGAAVVFPLGAVFALGGELVFGASWSLDDGAGLNASCVFVTSEGEVAIYQGSDPSNPADWQLKNVYKMGKPLGPQAWMTAGGDLVTATNIGFVPLSQAIQKELAVLGLSAVSYPIETAWNKEIDARPGGEWKVEIWPEKQMVVLALPEFPGSRSEMFIVNARTGAWSNFTGVQAECLHLFQGDMFVGTPDGLIARMETTGTDFGIPYTATYVPMFDDFGTPGSVKQLGAARAVFLAPADPKEKITGQVNYVVSLPVAPSAFQVAATSAWGSGSWGSAVWGQTRDKNTYQVWRGISGFGEAISVSVQVTSGAVVPPDVELVRLDLSAQTGASIA